MTKTTDYVGNMIYENGQLTKILVDGGYIENGQYHFYLTDHLGNNRVVANASGTPIQKNHYYPFGMPFAETSITEQSKQPYKFGNKEFDQMHGLNLYDFSARYYNPDIPRFTTIDPLAEKFYSWSPYVYCYNNPVQFIDPDGRLPIIPFVVIGIALFLNSMPVNAPTHDVEHNDRAMTEAWDNYNNNLVTTLAPVPGGPVTGKVSTTIGVQLAKEGSKQVEKVVIKEAKEVVEKTVETSRQARREVMREQGIPTSQPAKSQSKNASGREYTYEVPKERGGTQKKSVQQQTKNRSHENQPHWEAGKVKTDDGVVQMNNYGRPKLKNDKSKVYYKN